jgi:uncharacterized protein YodC (DUF2158 family)
VSLLLTILRPSEILHSGSSSAFAPRAVVSMPAKNATDSPYLCRWFNRLFAAEGVGSRISFDYAKFAPNHSSTLAHAALAASGL